MLTLIFLNTGKNNEKRVMVHTSQYVSSMLSPKGAIVLRVKSQMLMESLHLHQVPRLNTYCEPSIAYNFLNIFKHNFQPSYLFSPLRFV